MCEDSMGVVWITREKKKKKNLEYSQEKAYPSDAVKQGAEEDEQNTPDWGG